MRKLALLLLVAVSMSACGFTVVEAGHRAVKTTYGQVDNTVLQPGLHFYKPWSQDVDTFNVRQQTWTNDTSAYTADQQRSNINFTLTYSLDPSSVVTVYNDAGMDWEKKYIPPAVYDTMKDVIGDWTAADLITHRQQAGADIQAKLTARLAPYHVHVIQFAFNKIKYDQQYEQSVEDKVIAAQKALQEKNHTVQIQELAKQKVITAQAEAKSMQIRAKALEANKQLVQWEAVQKWNGILPQYMLGKGTLPFLTINPKGQ